MAKGIFPQMSIPDIVNALSGWGLSVSQEQLVRPSPDFVESVYCACLQQVADINHDAIRRPAQDSLERSYIDDQDIQATALTNTVILGHLSRFGRVARVEDFNARDLSNPQKERTLILLSAFINFVKFTEQYCNTVVHDLRVHSDTLLVDRDEVQHTIFEIERSIEVMETKIAEDEPRCEQIRIETGLLRPKVFATKEVQIALAQDVDALKAEKNSVVKRKESLNGEISSIAQSIARTRSRIVQSPERIKRTITTMSATAIEDKRTVAMHEAKARDLQIKMTAILNIERDVRGCTEQLQTMEREISLLRESQKEMADSKDLLDNKKIENNELKLRQERVEKQLSNASDKLERAQRHAEDKILAINRTIERFQREYDEMAIERRDNDKEVEELRAEASSVEAAIAEHLRNSEQGLNDLLAEYWKLRHDTDVYMETLANKLNMRIGSE